MDFVVVGRGYKSEMEEDNCSRLDHRSPCGRPYKLSRMLGFAFNKVDKCIYPVGAQPNLRNLGLVRARRSARYQ